MSRFLKAVFLYVGILLTLVLLINALFISRRDTAETDKFKTMPDNIDVCNFGSSHGMDGFLYPENAGLECFNFALGSQTASYDLRLMKNYIDRLRDEATVFLPVSYFSFFGLPEEETTDFEAKNKRYYFILPPSSIKGYDLKTDIFQIRFPALGADVNKLYSTFFEKPSAHDEWERATTAEYSAYEADARAYEHLVKNKLDENGQMIVNEEYTDAFREMIAICKSKNIRPVLITTPFLAEYREAVEKRDSDFLGRFYSIVNGLSEETGAEYYDYSCDGRFEGRYDLFLNVDHLNRHGAEQFTKIVFDEILGVTLQ